MTVTIFNNRFQYDALKIDNQYRLPAGSAGNLIRREMQSPEFIDPDKQMGKISAVYHLTERTDKQDGER